MIKIGLTGGIGSGKSTVSSILKQNGFTVVDADEISKAVLNDYPEILQTIRKDFGEGFFDWRGDFRRKEFGSHIFRFPKERKKYEELIMPYIKQEIIKILNDFENKKTDMIILDAPTLIENDLHEIMDYIILIWADTNTQIQRVKARDSLTKQEVINRINSQMSLEEKKDFANIIIENNDTFENTVIQVNNLMKFLKTL